MRIRDGEGSGREAGVDERSRLKVASVQQSVEHNANRQGSAWHVVVEQTATGANDYIYHFENTGVETYVIEGFNYRVASAEQLKVYLRKTGTTSGGTTATPVTVNSGSNRTVTGTSEAGNDITGLSGGDVIEHLFLTSTQTSSYNFDQDVFIEPGGTFSIEAISGSVQVNLTIIFHELASE